jgi:hypothetical protein
MKERILEKRKYILIDVPVNHVRLILWLTIISCIPPLLVHFTGGSSIYSVHFLRAASMKAGRA